MKKRLAALLCAALALTLAGCGAKEKSETRTVYAMDTVMTLTVYGAGAADALDAAEETLRTLDAALDRHDEASAVSALNRDGVSEDAALAALVETALTVGELSGGAFDPTLAPVLDAWGFSGETPRVPEAEELAALLARTGLEKASASGGRVTLSDGAQLDLGGIAKGYAADVLRAQLREAGAARAALDLGGDVCVMGTKDGGAWRVAVKDPADAEGYLGVLEAEDECIVTSGVYERYFEENGVRYHHILDPRTGRPAESGLVSVTVVCENGAWADALSTACFVLGENGALALRGDLAARGTAFELILVTDDGRVRYTEGLAGRFAPNEESGYAYETLA